MSKIMQIKNKINQLGQGKFQNMCDDYLLKLGYEHINSLGTKEGTNKATKGTPDTYFYGEDGKYIFVEYTTQKEGLAKKIRTDIEKCLDAEYTKIPLSNITEIIYCHTSSSITPKQDMELHKLCDNEGIKLILLGIDALAYELVKYPIIVKEYLNISLDTEQIQSVEDFLKTYNSKKTSITLNTPLMFREKELAEINMAFENTDIVILSGASGVGKTRLALEIANKYKNSNEYKVYCIHSRAIAIYDDILTYFDEPGKYFIFVDDANQLTSLHLIAEYVNKKESGYDVKIIVTVRDYTLKKVQNEIKKIAEFTLISIDIFTKDEITTIMKEHYNINNQFWSDRITTIAEGNIRIAMMAGKILVSGKELEKLQDVSWLYNEYYEDILEESQINISKEMLISAGIMAFMDSVHLEQLEKIAPILYVSGIDEDIFVNSLQRLHEHEVVDIYYDKAVKFSEQCLANFLLKYVFCDKKLISIASLIEVCFDVYSGKVQYAISTLLQVFRSQEVHKYIQEQVSVLWKKWETERNPLFFDYVKMFYPLNQTETLIILKNKIDAISPIEIEVNEIDTKSNRNYQQIDDDILEILGGFSDTDNVEYAIDLYFRYYLKRPDLYMQFYHTFTQYYSVDEYSAINKFKTQIEFVKKLYDYSGEWKNQYTTLLFYDVAQELLKLTFSSAKSSGRRNHSIILSNLSLNLGDDVAEYRGIIWEQLLEQAPNDKILNILKNYGQYMQESKEVMEKVDLQYIKKLISLYKKENLQVCLVAQHLKKVFDKTECNTEFLNEFLSSHKMQLYCILSGPDWKKEVDYNEREQLKENAIIASLHSCGNIINVFLEMFEIYKEISNYEISNGINMALKEVSNEKESYIAAVQYVIESEKTDGLDLKLIVGKLFLYLKAEDVFYIVSNSNKTQRNNWIYAYYCELPETAVNEKELAGLYTFLRDKSDAEITSSGYRDILLFEKFEAVDESVIINSSKIILEKQDYSLFMVKIYFELMFNDHYISPEVVISKYKKDIQTLEKIYMCIQKQDNMMDLHGKVLREICTIDKEFIVVFAEEVALNKDCYDADSYKKCLLIYDRDDCFDKINEILDQVSNKVMYASLHMPYIIGIFINLTNETQQYSDKRDMFIEQFIKKNSKDTDKMQAIFLAISQGQMYKYLQIFIHENKDFESFKKLYLLPFSQSWTGSAVPIYKSEQEYIKSLIPMFTGIEYIEHKAYMEKRASSYDSIIENIEIQEIMEDW